MQKRLGQSAEAFSFLHIYRFFWKAINPTALLADVARSITWQLTQTCSTTRAGKHAGRRHLVSTTRTIKPIRTILALGIGKPLLLFALGAHAIHFAVGYIVFENQAAFCADFGIATMVGSLTARRRADKDRMTGVTPVLTTGHLFTNRTFFHQNSSINSISASKGGNTSPPR